MAISFAPAWRAPGYANSATPRRADPATLQRLAGATMGTTWSLVFDNPALLPLDAVRSAVDQALNRVIDQMSTWQPDSDISRFNHADAGTRHALAPEFAAVLDCALRWAEASGGAMDPTVGPLVALWGFGADACEPAAAQVPPPVALAAAMKRVGWKRIALAPGTGSVLQPGGVALDLSGVAKGFAVDHVADALRALGLKNLLVEIGGELRGIGRRSGGAAWRVAVEGAHTIALTDTAVATSGDRWQVREREGRRWSHTIDPRRGEPTTHALAAVTVLHASCMEADALATALMVLGPTEGRAFAEAYGLAAHFSTNDGEGHRFTTSTAWDARVGLA